MRDDRKNVVDMDGTRVDEDYLLTMYIDGELDTVQTSILARRLESEQKLQARLEQLQANDQRVKQLFDLADTEIPERVNELLLSADGRVKRPLSTQSGWVGVAVAAAFFAVMVFLPNQNQNTDFNPMLMDVQLAQALQRVNSDAAVWSTLDDGRSFRAVLTFPAADGRWCREFLIAEDKSHWRGVACRNKDTWVTQVVGSEVFLEQATQYRTAGGLNSGQVARFIDETAADIALGPKQEAALIASGW